MAYSWTKFGQDLGDFFGWGTTRRAQELAASAHQIETEDLINAGINPVLSATSAGGAQTPNSQAGNGLMQISNIINSAQKAGEKSNEKTTKGLQTLMTAAQIIKLLG